APSADRPGCGSASCVRRVHAHCLRTAERLASRSCPSPPRWPTLWTSWSFSRSTSAARVGGAPRVTPSSTSSSRPAMTRATGCLLAHDYKALLQIHRTHEIVEDTQRRFLDEACVLECCNDRIGYEVTPLLWKVIQPEAEQRSRHAAA